MNTKSIVLAALCAVAIIWSCSSPSTPDVTPEIENPEKIPTEKEQRVLELKKKYATIIDDISDFNNIVEQEKLVTDYKVVAATNEDRFSVYYISENNQVAYAYSDTLTSEKTLNVESITDPGHLNFFYGVAINLHEEDNTRPDLIRIFYLSDDDIIHLLDVNESNISNWGGYKMYFSNGFMHYDKHGTIDFHRIRDGELLHSYKERIEWSLLEPYIIYDDANEVCFLEPVANGRFKVTSAKIALNNGQPNISWINSNSIYLPVGTLESGESYDRSFLLEVKNGFLEINVKMTITKFNENGDLFDTVTDHSYKFDMDSGELIGR